MLKSLVGITLCGILIFNALHAVADVPAKVYDGLFVSSAGAARTGVFSRQLQHFVDSYLKENDVVLAGVRERSGQPFTIIDSVMDHYDLPQELRYLAVIESDLVPTAMSRVGAKGPWQLMAGTARDLGLKVSRRSDERTNYYKSTAAAALYLRDLHREFKDWLLVLAAYNAGPGPVYRAIRKSGSRNFWALERYLPKETRRHIRRFIATEYYFAISGPVVDPVPAGPAGGQDGFLGDMAVSGYTGNGLSGDGYMGTGLTGEGSSECRYVGSGLSGSGLSRNWSSGNGLSGSGSSGLDLPGACGRGADMSVGVSGDVGGIAPNAGFGLLTDNYFYYRL